MVLGGELVPTPFFCHPHPHSRNPSLSVSHPSSLLCPSSPQPCAHLLELGTVFSSRELTCSQVPRSQTPPAGRSGATETGREETRRRERERGWGMGRRRWGLRRPLLRDSGKGISREEEVGYGRGLKGRGQERGPRRRWGKGGVGAGPEEGRCLHP